MIVVKVGLGLVAFPVGLVLFYLAQKRPDPTDNYQATGDGP